MMKVLLSIEDKTSRDMILFVLESQLRAQVAAGDAKESLEAFKKQPSFDAIVLEISDKSPALAAAIAKKTPPTPCIALSKNKSKPLPDQGLKKILATLDFSQVEELCRTLTALSPSSSKNEEPEVKENELCRIRTNLLMRVVPLNCDILIRLSETKFLRIFQKGDVFDNQDLEKYMVKKKIEYFFIKASDSGDFIHKFKANLEALLKLPPDKQALSSEIAESTHETVAELIRTAGLTEEVQSIVKTSVALTISAMGSSPKLSKILNQLNKDRNKYIASHSMLLGTLACTIAANMEWSSETTFQKLSLAAFLHDITLTNNALASLSSLGELEKHKSEFKESERKAFASHPSSGAEMAKKFNEVPPDVDVIIAQHHEEPDGSGFPRGINHSRISPLAGIFIVAHDLLRYMLAHEKDLNIAEYVESRKDKYNVGIFKKALKVVGEMKL